MRLEPTQHGGITHSRKRSTFGTSCPVDGEHHVATSPVAPHATVPSPFKMLQRIFLQLSLTLPTCTTLFTPRDPSSTLAPRPKVDPLIQAVRLGCERKGRASRALPERLSLHPPCIARHYAVLNIAKFVQISPISRTTRQQRANSGIHPLSGPTATTPRSWSSAPTLFPSLTLHRRTLTSRNTSNNMNLWNHR